jgi:ADP-glucose pyrophosphorylase
MIINNLWLIRAIGPGYALVSDGQFIYKINKDGEIIK